MAKQKSGNKSNDQKGVRESKQTNYGKQGAGSTKGSGTSTRPKKAQK